MPWRPVDVCRASGHFAGGIMLSTDRRMRCPPSGAMGRTRSGLPVLLGGRGQQPLGGGIRVVAAVDHRLGEPIEVGSGP